MTFGIDLLWGIGGFIVGGSFMYFYAYKSASGLLNRAKQEAENIKDKASSELERAKLEAEVIISKAKERASKLMEDFYKTWEEKQKELDRFQYQLESKQRELEKLRRDLQLKEEDLKARDRQVNLLYKEAQEVLQRSLAELERISGMTREEARTFLLKKVEDESRLEIAKVVKRIEEEYMQEAERKAKYIILLTLGRITPTQVSEHTVSTVNLPSDEFKGKIIGREGRNIKFFEELTGVDVIIDDTPEVVTVSCFDPIRREIARVTLERLISMGKINIATIQETYERVSAEIELMIEEAGQNAALEAMVPDLHPELVKLLGKLKYRTSYGQNVLQHSVQVANISAILAAELKADVRVARRAGLLHDIGKAMTAPSDEPHAVIGARLARTYGEPDEVVHAIEAHHNDVEPKTLEAHIVAIADAISAARPGARRESYELFIQRLKRLEEIVMSFEGVNKAYVIQAGRQVVAFVNPDTISDGEIYLLSKEIAKRIEQELTYPGQIKVNVIRKLISQEVAR